MIRDHRPKGMPSSGSLIPKKTTGNRLFSNASFKGEAEDWRTQPFEQRLNPQAVGSSSEHSRVPPSSLSGRISFSGSGGWLQPKLRINPPGDRFEQEADRVAEAVARGDEAGGTVSRANAISAQKKCAECEEKEKAKEMLLQRKEKSPDDKPVDEPPPVTIAVPVPEIMTMERNEAEAPQQTIARKPAPASEIDTPPSIETKLTDRSTGGNPLPESERAFYESRIGADFSGVRLHTDSQAIQMSRDLNARAFTVGNHIYFGAGEYSAGTTEGRKLIAHELTHTVQQSGAGSQVQRKKKKPARPPRLVYLRVLSLETDTTPDDMMLTFIQTLFNITDREKAKEVRKERNFYWAGTWEKPVQPNTWYRFTFTAEEYDSRLASVNKVLGAAPGTPRPPKNLEELPEEIKHLLGFAPADLPYDYQQLATIGEKLKKLKKLDPELFKRWKEFSVGSTSNLTEFENLVDKLLGMPLEKRRQILDKTPAAENRLPHKGYSFTFGAPKVPDAGIVQIDGGTGLYRDPADPIEIQHLPLNSRLHILQELDTWYGVVTEGGDFGYVKGHDVNIFMPEPDARLYRVKPGDTALGIVRKFFGAHAEIPRNGKPPKEKVVDWGHDYRYFINVLLYINQRADRNGIEGKDWEDSKVEAGKQIWIPSTDYALTLRAKVSSGSFTYEAFSALMDNTLGRVVFVAGALHGALESLWDMVVGIIDLVGLAIKMFDKLFKGELLGAIEKKMAAISIGDISLEGIIDGIDAKWHNPDFFERWHYRGWIIGYIIMEVITTIYSGGATAVLKRIGKSAEVTKLLTWAKTFVNAEKIANKLRTSEEGIKLLQKISRGKEMLGEGIKWANDIFRKTPGIVADLSYEAIRRLQQLPAKVTDWLARQSEGFLRLVLGCHSPCKVVLEDILAFYNKTAGAAERVGKRLETVDDVIQALPPQLKRLKIESYLHRDDRVLMKLIKQAELTDTDFLKLHEIMEASKGLGSGLSYKTFTKYLNQIVVVKIGPDTKKLREISEALVEMAPEGGKAARDAVKQGNAIKGVLNENFTKLYVEGLEHAETQVRFTIRRKGGALYRRTDMYDPSLSEIWELKNVSSDVDIHQAQDLASLVTSNPNARQVNQVNYLFTSREAAEQQKKLRGISNLGVYYLSETPVNGKLIPVRLHW